MGLDLERVVLCERAVPNLSLHLCSVGLALGISSGGSTLPLMEINGCLKINHASCESSSYSMHTQVFVAAPSLQVFKARLDEEQHPCPGQVDLE